MLRGDCHITPLFALTSHWFWPQSFKNTTLRPFQELVRLPSLPYLTVPSWKMPPDTQCSIFRICGS